MKKRYILLALLLLGAISLHAQTILPFEGEFQVTSTSAYETTPKLGNDGISDLIVFTARSDASGAGDIWYQRLASGAPSGLPVQVTFADSDDQLNDVWGDYIVYTAYNSLGTAFGSIMLYNISSKTVHTIASADIMQEAKIHDNYVVWLEGGPFSARVMLYNIDWLGTNLNPFQIAGTEPPTFQVDIADRLVVWTEYEDEQFDVVVRDLEDATTFNISNTPLADESNPSTFGPWVVWSEQQHNSESASIVLMNVNTWQTQVIAENGAYNLNPSISGDLIVWESNVNNTMDIFAYRLSTGETYQVTTQSNDQYLNDVLGNLIVYADNRDGETDIYLTDITARTYVPDDNFELYLETHDANGHTVSLGDPISMGDGIDGNDYVNTSRISEITSLDVSNESISDLTGIEDFMNLTELQCFGNQLTTLDVTQNTVLLNLQCHENNLSSLDISQNTALTNLVCVGNNLTNLDLSQNTALTSLNCSTNLLASLDLSQNVALSTLNCAGNQLASLDVSNNLSLSNFDARFNPSLTCIQVDNESDANAGLPPYDNWLKDNDARYSEDCSTLSIYFGDLTLSSQAEVDAFIYTEVTGRLTISGNDINDLSPLSSLITVSGGFYIDNNDALTSLVGLENLSSVGEYVWIQNNEILSSLSSLSSLTSVGGYIWIFNNDVLKNLNGLENITSVVGSLAVSNNDKLTSLSGLENITSVGGYISFSGNALLTSLNELGNLTSVGESIRILSNAALTSLSGLENITSIVEDLVINNNNVLTSLVGLENITSVGEDINISYNDVLTSFCSLYELINGGGLTGTYTVTGNAVNLTQQEIIDGGSCPRIYIGDLSLHFQSEVNAFNYSEVTGSLTINGSDITDLTPLSSLTSVGENLRVYYNTVLSSLSGLENLVSLRGLIIYNNPALTNLSGLNNVALIEGHLDIHGNPALTSLSGLVNVTSIEGNFRIFENPALTSLSGLLTLTSVVGDVWIWNNPVLSSIFEPSTLTSVGGKLDIYENPELISISGFSSIDGGVYIALNPALVNLFDLSTLTSVGGTFAIISNESLTCLFDLSTLTSVGEGFTISNNPSLTRLSGLEVLTSIGGPLQIVKNGLTSLSGLETLNTVGALNISDNTSLNSLSGLEALTFVMGDVIIWYNPSLASLFELSSLTTVEGNIYIASNASITGLSGLENLNSVKGDLDILHNTALTHFCTLYDLMDIGGLTGTYSVTGNAYNPAQQEIIDNGPCNLSVNIPDTNFEQSLIDLGIDSDDKINKQILRSDAEGVILLNLSNPTENSNLPNVEAKIADLTGIEAFVDLQTLLCNDNLLTSLNLSQHNYLNTLQCRSNQLTGLDVSANHGLVNLSCEHNQISELDIGQNSALASIDCSYNLLSELDVSNNPSLTRIFCAGNQLSALDVSNNIALDYLYMNQNSIGSLDVTNNTELTFLICYDNNLKSLDISQNTKLYGLSCYENQLSTLDLSNNPSLTELQCRDNQLTELNIKNGNNANVTRFSAHNNLLSCINVDNELDDHSTWQADPGVIFSNDCGYNTQRGVDVKVALLDKITSEKTAEVTFYDVELSGETTIEVTKEVVSISSLNFIGEKTVYNIETTAVYAGDIDITIDYAKEDIVNEDGIRLFHKKGETWEDVTTSVDQENDEVHGTTSSLSPFVIIEDIEPPVLSGVPDDLILKCSSDVPENPEVTVTDNVDQDVTIEYNEEIVEGECANNVTITKTWSASDDFGNTVSASQVITVVDNLAPVLTAPADVTLECDADYSPAATGTATATDNCDEDVSVSYEDVVVLGCGNTRVITRTWTATDACYNSAAAVQTITIIDTTPPDITLPFNVTVEFGTPTDPASMGVATALDNCMGEVQISHADVFVPGIGNLGIIKRTWTAIDECGNTSSSIQTITIVDTTPPIVVVNNINLPLDETGHAALSPDAIDNGSNDGSGIASLSLDQTEFSCENLGANTVELTVTDSHGNSSTATANVTVFDDFSPVITAPADVTIECDGSTDPSATGMATALDNCGVNVSISHEDEFVADCESTGVITRTWTAKDDAGNTASSVQVITVVDDLPPVITVPADVTIECDESTDPSVTGMATTLDNCGEILSISHEDEFVADCGATGVITRTWSATDACGNVGASIQTITIVDTVLPILSNLRVPLDPVPVGTLVSVLCDHDDEQLAEATIDWGDGFQSFGEITASQVTGGYIYSIPGVYVLSLYAWDACGNEASISHEYIVVYDPDGGFVTGGGWIYSPPGAYISDPALEGKANFGFVSKYKKGTTVPIGNTEFQFKAGDLNFKSDLYDWLVVAGEKAKFKGEGTINEGGSYGFMISAIDGDEKDMPDMFRMKIWEKSSDVTVYDNQFESDDTSDPTTILGGGSIVVHDGKDDKNKRIASNIPGDGPTNQNVEIKLYPNPVRDVLTVDFGRSFSEEKSINIHLYNLTGVDMIENHQRSISNNRLEIDINDLPSGIYILVIPYQEHHFKHKLTKL